MKRSSIVAALALCLAPVPAAARFVPVEEQSIADLQAMLKAGKASSVDLVKAYLERIAKLDRK